MNATTAQTSPVIEVTDATFNDDILQSPAPALVDFWAPWCGPCKMIAPAVAELAARYEGRARVAKVNVDDNPEAAARYGISSIPTLLFFKDGAVVDHAVGVVSPKTLAAKLDALL
jgi:thioredoxin 1